MLIACLAVDGFATTQNLSSILFTTVSIGIAACGLALVTISGNLFMLSISAITSISTIVFASLLNLGIPAAIVLTLAVGVILGSIQGGAVGVLKTNPIITTIAASSIITGIASWVSVITSYSIHYTKLYDVPEQVSLIGFDNDTVLDYLTPTVSSVQLSAHAFVTYAMNLLLTKLNETDLPLPEAKSFTGDLVLRQSVRGI